MHENSIAANAGLRQGDIIVRINDTAATPLTHDQSNKIINSLGNVFYFGIQRLLLCFYEKKYIFA